MKFTRAKLEDLVRAEIDHQLSSPEKPLRSRIQAGDMDGYIGRRAGEDACHTGGG